MLKLYIWKVFNWLNKYIAAPRMIVGYKRYDGVFLPRTRISNTVNIVRPEKLNISDNVYIGHHSILECSHGLTIGEGCQISAYVMLTSHSSHNSIRLYGNNYIGTTSPIGYVTGEIKIGKYTYLGAHAVIMPGTQIGKGSLVAAYSLVKGEFPDFAIIAGNPAVLVGDTRKNDQLTLAKYPELQQYYDGWAK